MKGMSDNIGDEILLRRLNGELTLDEERALGERLANDGALAARFERLGALWSSLELPPTAAVPRAFAADVVARAQGASLWALAPNWVRGSAVAALAAGLLLGLGVGDRLFSPPVDGSETVLVAQRGPLAPTTANAPTHSETVEGPRGTSPTPPPATEPRAGDPRNDLQNKPQTDPVNDPQGDPESAATPSELGEEWFGGESFADRYWSAIDDELTAEVEGTSEELP